MDSSTGVHAADGDSKNANEDFGRKAALHGRTMRSVVGFVQIAVRSQTLSHDATNSFCALGEVGLLSTKTVQSLKDLAFHTDANLLGIGRRTAAP